MNSKNLSVVYLTAAPLKFLVLFGGLVGCISASEADNGTNSQSISRSWVPIVGYNPTYRFFAGGGFFFEKDNHLAYGIYGIATQEGVLKFEANTTQPLNEQWRFYIQDMVATGFESNYGAGNETKAKDRVDVPMFRNQVEGQLNYYFQSQHFIGAVTDFHNRRSDRKKLSVGDQLKEKDPYPENENTYGAGVHQVLDFRNNEGSPTFGWYESSSIIHYPSLTQTGNHASFTVVRGEFRTYEYFLKKCVAAFHISGGFSLGEPSYATSFRLGGTDRLRGFYDSRFRGNKFYLQQTEFRFPVYKALSGTVFLDFGEATVTTFSLPSASYGGGIRIALPPDYLTHLRLDYGATKDQRGVFFDFGHAF